MLARDVPNFDKDVLTPLRVAQAEKAAEDAEKARIVEEARLAKIAEEARLAEEVAKAARVALEATGFQPSRAVAPAAISGELVGSLGYAHAGGNCVNTAKAYGKNQPGNPDTWIPTTQTPFIGAAALFYYRHVAVVVGIWSNGDIEVVQENVTGGRHRYSQSEIRGYF